MDRWIERLGYTVQWLSDNAQDVLHSASEAASHLTDTLEAPFEDPSQAGEASHQEISLAVLTSAAGGWLATRLLRPSPVRWSSVILAGVAGTLLYDAEMLLDQRVSGRKLDTIGPLGAALTDDPDLQPWAGWTAHYMAGVGLAVIYARYLYHRLPGPPLVRGAVFGILDAVTLTWGGVLPLLQRAVPGVRLPPGYKGLAHAPVFTTQSLLRHTAYGIGLGLLYRE